MQALRNFWALFFRALFSGHFFPEKKVCGNVTLPFSAKKVFSGKKCPEMPQFHFSGKKKKCPEKKFPEMSQYRSCIHVKF